jgi:hypothetical protein
MSRVDPTVLHPIIASGHIPVIAIVATDQAGQAHNINADTGDRHARRWAPRSYCVQAIVGTLSAAASRTRCCWSSTRNKAVRHRHYDHRLKSLFLNFFLS